MSCCCSPVAAPHRRVTTRSVGPTTGSGPASSSAIGAATVPAGSSMHAQQDDTAPTPGSLRAAVMVPVRRAISVLLAPLAAGRRHAGARTFTAPPGRPRGGRCPAVTTAPRRASRIGGALDRRAAPLPRCASAGRGGHGWSGYPVAASPRAQAVPALQSGPRLEQASVHLRRREATSAAVYRTL